MNEDIPAAAIWGKEAETLALEEMLDGPAGPSASLAPWSARWVTSAAALTATETLRACSLSSAAESVLSTSAVAARMSAAH